MDCQKQKIKNVNPRENANLLSIAFFTYVFETFRTGTRRDLNSDDIYKVLKNCESEKLCKRLEKEWKKELKTGNPSIFKAFLRMFGVEFALWAVGIFLFGMIVHNLVQPILTGKLMTYFEPGHDVSKSQAFAYIVGIVASTVFFVLFDNTYLLSLLTIGLKLRIACCSLIYKKCLKLNLNLNPEYQSGKAVTLITKDVSQFANTVDYGQMLVLALPKFLIIVSLMYRTIGVATFVGNGCLLILIPFCILLGKLTASYRLKTAAKTDKRVKITQEVITAMKIIKMYTWETFFIKYVNKLRLEEIRNLKIVYWIKGFAYSIGEMGARVAFYVCVVTYIYLGNYITAENAFIVVACFNELQVVFSFFIPLGITQMAELKASLQRITEFLMLEDVPRRQNNDCDNKNVGRICVKNVTLKTTKQAVILENINLDIEKGLTLVTGPTGAGKSTLLKLFLGDITKGDGKVDVYGVISYASQDPWLFPATIRQNILFGEKFEQNRYKKVIEVCALQKDIDSFPRGDGTLVNDKGLNLSKGQKARINLARAVYKQADVYLIDDCFSSVDSGVGSHIFSECIKTFLKNHLCVLVTHNFSLIEYTDHLLVLDKKNVEYIDKKKCQNDFKRLSIIEKYSRQTCEDLDVEVTNDNTNESSTLLKKRISNANSMYEETKQVGAVNKKIYYAYFISIGGLKIISLVIVFALATQVAVSCADYFVSFWVDIERELSEFKLNKTTNSTEYQKLEESHSNLIKFYSFVTLTAGVFTVARTFVFFVFTSKVSTKIHNLVLDKLLKTGIVFFDTNLSGNVLNRFTRDLGVIDELLPGYTYEFIRMSLSIVATFVVVSSVNIYFIIPSGIFMIILYFGKIYYLKTGRSLRRLEGAARSPVIGHLNATMEGLTTIRANGAQKILKTEYDKHQDHYSSVFYMNLSTTFGFGLYLDLICACYIAVITLTFLFLKTDTQAGKIGLAITQSIGLTENLKWFVRVWAEMENHMTSTERILEYKDVEVENNSGVTYDSWPKYGSISYKNVNLAYVLHGKKVLQDINFKIEPKEKIGVIGRTGAGKTSIISTLFRMYDFEGTITIDDIDITKVPINHLRSQISIIPQDPVLFSGTVRSNLDPYQKYSDNVLWEALEEVEIKNSISNLDNKIYEGGFDFSIGEKQLFCLARAIIHNNSILILDEATANIDAQTDSLIQKVIKKKFSNCTIITIAHRLNTVLDLDKILVIDSGKVVQFGSPKDLLKNESGLFFNMIKACGLI